MVKSGDGEEEEGMRDVCGEVKRSKGVLVEVGGCGWRVVGWFGRGCDKGG